MHNFQIKFEIFKFKIILNRLKFVKFKLKSNFLGIETKKEKNKTKNTTKIQKFYKKRKKRKCPQMASVAIGTLWQ